MYFNLFNIFTDVLKSNYLFNFLVCDENLCNKLNMIVNKNMKKHARASQPHMPFYNLWKFQGVLKWRGSIG